MPPDAFERRTGRPIMKFLSTILLISAVFAAGCTLVTDVDRDKIAESEGQAGTVNSATGGSGGLEDQGSGGSAGKGTAGAGTAGAGTAGTAGTAGSTVGAGTAGQSA